MVRVYGLLQLLLKYEALDVPVRMGLAESEDGAINLGKIKRDCTIEDQLFPSLCYKVFNKPKKLIRSIF